jgi:hypothetical protein
MTIQTDKLDLADSEFLIPFLNFNIQIEPKSISRRSGISGQNQKLTLFRF